MFEHVREADDPPSSALISHTHTRTYTHVSGGGIGLLDTDGGVRKTEAKLSNHKDRMDTENIDKKKKRGVC